MIEIIVASAIVIVSIGLIFYTLHTSSPKRNHDWKTKIREMSKIFNDASDHIYIKTDLATQFFGDTGITDSLEKAAKRGVKIRIVYDPAGYQLDEEQLSGLRNLIRARRIKARKAKEAFTKENDRHIMEIDGAWARLETFHPARQMIEAKADARIYHSPIVAYFAKEEFDKLWPNPAKEHAHSTRN
jgi:phosphatidylserine/phosphatidylglycerophosphate/cardiolipin synthase-like enzyme